MMRYRRLVGFLAMAGIVLFWVWFVWLLTRL